MPRRPKKPPWNKDLKMPGIGGEPLSPEPKPMPPPSGPAATLTTGRMVPQESTWECGRCENIREGLSPGRLEHSPRCPYLGTGRDPEPRG